MWDLRQTLPLAYQLPCETRVVHLVNKRLNVKLQNYDVPTHQRG